MPQANPCGNFMRLKPKNGLVSTPTHEEDSTVVHAVFFFSKSECTCMDSVFPKAGVSQRCPTFEDAPSMLQSADAPSDRAQDRLLKLHIS